MEKRVVLCILIILVLFLHIEYSQSQGIKKKRRCKRITIPNARVRIRAKGQLARIRCHSGYVMIEGDKRLTCIRNEWKGRIPHCIKSGCGDVYLTNGDTVSLYERALVHFSCNPGYNLEGSPAVFCDGSKWNASFPVCRVPPANPDHLSCTFESSAICDWTQDYADDYEWKWTQALMVAFTGSLGAKYDHTFGALDGHYIFADSREKWTSETTARLFSPILELPLFTPACVVLYYHMYGPSSGSFNVYIKPESIPIDLLVPYFSATGFHSDAWKMGFMFLDDTIEDWFQVVLEVRGGDGPMVDVAVDDFEVASGYECFTLEYKFENQATSSTTRTTLLPTTTAEQMTTFETVIDDSQEGKTAPWSTDDSEKFSWTTFTIGKETSSPLTSTLSSPLPNISASLDPVRPPSTKQFTTISTSDSPSTTTFFNTTISSFLPSTPLETTSSPLPKRVIIPSSTQSHLKPYTVPSVILLSTITLQRKTLTTTMKPITNSTKITTTDTTTSLGSTISTIRNVPTTTTTFFATSEHASPTASPSLNSSAGLIEENRSSSSPPPASGTPSDLHPGEFRDFEAPRSGAPVSAVAISSLIIGAVAVGIVLAFFWRRQKGQRQLRRLKEDTSEEEPRKTGEGDEEEQASPLRRPFTTSYNRLLETTNNSDPWVSPTVCVDEGTPV